MDLRDAIEKVMQEAHGKDLAKMGMDSKGKVASHSLRFDSQQNQLEPIYYWILDFASQVGWNMDKSIDNFMASPGSGQFSEVSMKATRMQEEGMKILGGMNQIIKSILNLIYDLKEFELRLAHYDDAKSDDKQRREQGLLALKQIWLDNVDIKRGRGSIHQMASMEMGFSTLREAFMIANNVDDVKRMNSEDVKEGGSGLINDSVMRILIPRISEFLKWADYSEKEMRKRFSIEKNYLKSQVESVKLYSQWMKPYLVAAEQLRQKGFEKNAALVNAFSTTMFELQLFGRKSVDVGDVYGGSYDPKRGYNKVIFITMEYRGHVSQRVTQKGDYAFGMGGVVDIVFDAYAVNDEELAVAQALLEKDDLGKSMEFSLDIASEALEDLKEDLDYFLSGTEREEDDKEEKKKEEDKGEDINPFAALFGLFWRKKEKKKEEGGVLDIKDIKKDNFVEKMMRGGAIQGAAESLFLIYDIYKKSHGMASASFTNYDADVAGKLSEGGSIGWREALRGIED